MARNITTATDSLDFFVQSQDSLTSIVSVAATTSNATFTSADIKNTLHKGAAFYIFIGTLTVNSVTLGININGKNAVDGLYYPLIRTSLDGIAANGNLGAEIYPGLVDSNATGGSIAHAEGVLPAVFQVVASLTVTTTASMTGTFNGFKMGMSKVL
jgi:hypothetical protein